MRSSNSRQSRCRALARYTTRATKPAPVSLFLVLGGLQRGGGDSGRCDEKDLSFFNPSKYKVQQPVFSCQEQGDAFFINATS